ncbi:MAG: OmpA family protein [Pseudomonadota bacterium]
MRFPYLIAVTITFALAAAACLVGASFAVTSVEQNSEIVVRRALDENDHGWAEVQADGLRVILSGIAPNEATRFNALTVVGAEVDASRVIDELQIQPSADLDAPRFSVEILRNDSGISVIGLIPRSTDRTALVDALESIPLSIQVTDLLETADYPAPDGWSAALGYGVTALGMLPRSKISVESNLVRITAIADSAEAKEQLEAELNRVAPPLLRTGVDISAPRPVIAPFTLRYLIDETGGRFDACSAENNLSRDRILRAARSIGLTGSATCVVGLGVPSPKWASAAEQSISALAELGRGSVTLADADITLVAAQGTDQGLFDRVVGELENALPPVFALHAVLPEPESEELAGPPEFTATLSPEGLVQLRGRIGDESTRNMVDSFARAAFGSEAVYTATRIAPDLPSQWPVRVLAGLEALAMLRNGAVTVSPETLLVRGISHRETAGSEISRLLSEKLGEAQDFDLSIVYEEPPVPEDQPPDPEFCEAQIAEIQSRAKIAFEPGSSTIASDSLPTMDQIAQLLTECGQIRMEIQGHTDSQGREEMNRQLSQARAQSVLNELRARRVLTTSYAATGYGETQPIADNDTDEGRQANRRIEFRLVRPETREEEPTGLDALEQAAEQVPSADDPADPQEAGD